MDRVVQLKEEKSFSQKRVLGDKEPNAPLLLQEEEALA